ncbi:hypothetical protein MBOURGENBZM_17410 [Methanoculleus bourgensis]|nr:hypothetical protein MBOURGENBZM_17410 [Methanoculleus bourgensis]
MRGESETKRRGAAPIPQLAQGVFPLCPFNPAEIKNRLVIPRISRYCDSPAGAFGGKSFIPTAVH